MDTRRMRAWAEISLSNLEHNYKEIRRHLPEKCHFLGVVKADAYGHGAVRVAERLQKLGADYLAVACLDEAVQLRQAGIYLPILILGRTEPTLAPVLAEQGLTQAVGSLEDAQALSQALDGRSCKVHIKLDTGMSRLGFRVDESEELAQAAAVMMLKGLEPEGVFTHFAVSDELPESENFTRVQFAHFQAAIAELESRSGRSFSLRHSANSGAVLHYPEMVQDMVRPGLLLYGMYPDSQRENFDLRPVMTVKARIVAVKELHPGDSVSYGRTFIAQTPMRIAVVSIGYADGLHRVLSGRMQMLVKGRVAHQLGRICMDLCMVDITDIPEVKPGDVAVVFGRDGQVVQPVEVLAEAAQTISYEMVCAVSRRVPRIYC